MMILGFPTFCVSTVSTFDCCICLLVIFIEQMQRTPNNAHMFSMRNYLSTLTAMPNGKLSNVLDAAVAIGLLINPPWPVTIMPLATELIGQQTASHFMLEPCACMECKMVFTVFIDTLCAPILAALSNAKMLT